MKYVVYVSGGRASFEALRRTVDRHGREAVDAVFTDTRIEDADLYRFLDDIERVLAIPITRLADGRDIWQVFKDRRVLGNTLMDTCSETLKRKPALRYVKSRYKPGDATLVLGLDWQEPHRIERVAANYGRLGYATWFPLTDAPYLWEADYDRILKQHGIEVPRLYQLGFSHNNCGGGCVKAGKYQWRHLWETLPDRYLWWEQNEQTIRDYLGKDVHILKDMTLAEFRAQLQANPQMKLPLFDEGACSCFVEPFETEVTA